jgi:hypothetical protein
MYDAGAFILSQKNTAIWEALTMTDALWNGPDGQVGDVLPIAETRLELQLSERVRLARWKTT